VELPRILLNEEARQERDVLFSFGERRSPDLHHREPVKEIFPKLLLRDRSTPTREPSSWISPGWTDGALGPQTPCLYRFRRSRALSGNAAPRGEFEKKDPHRGTAPHHSFELRILKNAIVDRCGAFTAAPFRIASTADSLV